MELIKTSTIDELFEKIFEDDYCKKYESDSDKFHILLEKNARYYLIESSTLEDMVLLYMCVKYYNELSEFLKKEYKKEK